jgi:chromosome segregation ATPase
MATATIVISDKQLEFDLDRLRKEAAEIERKLDSDNSKLNAARAELQRLVEQIAGGSAEAGVLQRVKNELETLEIRIGGYNGQLAANRATTEGLQAEIARRQAAAAKAEREKQFAERFQKCEAKALQFRDKITRLITEDLRQLEEDRASLMEFLDLDGHRAAQKVLEVLFKPPRPQEALRNSEVHLAELDRAGWVPFGFEVSESTNLQGRTQLRLKPGPPLRLTIVSLRPKK